ncbi:MAG: thioredoxin family protein [Myxococcota bacterium]
MSWVKRVLGLEQGPMPVSINDENFDEEVVQSELPVVLDVWSSTCAPCKKLEPIIMDLARAYDGRVKVCEMGVENGLRSASRLGVRGTPTVLYMRGGKEVERIVGFRGSLYHEQTIEELFGVPK